MEKELLKSIASLLDEKLDQKLAPIHVKLDEHGRKLDEHGRKLDEHGRILDDHGQILNEHGRILNEHGRILNEHGRILNEQSRILNEHSRKLDEHSNILKEHSEQLTLHGTILKEQYGILKALEHAAEVNAAEQHKTQSDITYIKGSVQGLRRDMARVEEITAYNMAEIAKLKSASNQ